MYGYLKYNPISKHHKLFTIYRKYYCGLCSSLKVNCGLFASLFLSYDMTFIAILLSDMEFPVFNCDKCTICKSKKLLRPQYDNKYWCAMATNSLGLVYAKLFDDYRDEHTLKSRVILSLFKFLFRKSILKHIQLFNHYINKIDNLSKIEGSFDVLDQGNYTSEMLLKGLCDFSGLSISPNKKELLTAIIQWVCLVDAIDDYADDVINNRYNPLFAYVGKEKSATNNVMISKFYREIATISCDITDRIKRYFKKISMSEDEYLIIQDMIFRQMPATYTNVMKGI